MRSVSLNPKRKQPRPWLALAGAVLAMLIAAGNPAGALDHRSERPVESIASRPAGDAIMAIVSLRNQQITVYDAKGWILRAPVSSGQKERETPAGIFSVIQKDADHHSNLYDDANMPHMQRLTWSGIALHGGPLPGYPASHGCVRMPFEFAAHLFDMTLLGLRVIVSPTDVAPVEIVHPALFLSKPGAGALAAARTAEADEAEKNADRARLVAGTAFRASGQAMAPVRMAENLKLRAEVQLAAAETALGSAISSEAKQQAERAKEQALARIADLQMQLDAAKAELQPKLDALTSAREASAAAEAAQVAAAEAARQVTREQEPVSVLISRKTQRLYVRQAFEPILESPVTILDADHPIGTHIFTAVERTSDEADMRWNVVSLEGRRAPGGAVEPPAQAGGSDGRQPVLADPGSAKDALDRIVIPQDALDRIARMAPRSSVIVTDEAPSPETGKGTEFVVVLSGEPQGGIKMRQRGPEAEFRFDQPHDRMRHWRSPFAGPYSAR
jgi:L,D-transpeptidase catalytic domain